MLWWIYLCLWFLLWFFSLICLQVVFLGQRICSFHSCSSSLVCLDALSSSNKPSFLMSYRFWSHQFLLSCVFPRKFDYDCSFFFLNAKIVISADPFVTNFSKSPVSSFSLKESGHACYFSSIIAAMASKSLVMFSESCTLCPQWYWICFCTVSRDKVLNWPCHILNG